MHSIGLKNENTAAGLSVPTLVVPVITMANEEADEIESISLVFTHVISYHIFQPKQKRKFAYELNSLRISVGHKDACRFFV